MPASLQFTLDFLQDLRFNNHKAWFDENRKRYEQARATFEAFVGDIIQHFKPVEDLGNTTVKECLYRINRDIRFSKDKTPYNAHMAALIGKGGRKGEGRGYYVHIEPGASMIAGGFYMPTPEQLKQIREAIADKPAKLRAVLDAPDFKKYYGQMEGDKLKTAPKGYTSDHPALDLLQYKQFLASHKLQDEEVLAEHFTADVVKICAALKPFVGYFADVLGASG